MPDQEVTEYCFTLVFQGGRLEIPSILLAASLAKFLKCNHSIVACIPDYPGCELPRTECIDFIESLGVSIRYIDNYVDRNYPIANKVSCLLPETVVDKMVFMDSDMICIRPFYGLDRIFTKPFSAKLTDLVDLTEREWGEIYSQFGMDRPESVFESTVTKDPMPLVFNSGVIFVDSQVQFGKTWLEIMQHLDAIEGLPGRRPFLDQIAIPFVLDQRQIGFDLLPEEYNYPSEIRPLDPLALPYFVHYHDVVHIHAEKVLCQTVAGLAAEYSGLESVLCSDRDGRLMLKGR